MPSQEEFHATGFQLSTTPTDCVIDFLCERPSSGGIDRQFKEVGRQRIVMSLASAKRLVIGIGTVIAQMEKALGGPILIPEMRQPPEERRFREGV